MKHEDQNIEYKQSWREEYLKWICGFANADGGRMLIGVKDDKDGNEIVGVPDWKSLLEAIPNLMRDTMGMRMPGCDEDVSGILEGLGTKISRAELERSAARLARIS